MLGWTFHTAGMGRKQDGLIVERHSASTLKSSFVRFSCPGLLSRGLPARTRSLQRHFSHQHQHLLGGYKKLAHYSLPVHNGRGTGKAGENAPGRGKKEKKKSRQTAGQGRPGKKVLGTQPEFDSSIAAQLGALCC